MPNACKQVFSDIIKSDILQFGRFLDLVRVVHQVSYNPMLSVSGAIIDMCRYYKKSPTIPFSNIHKLVSEPGRGGGGKGRKFH